MEMITTGFAIITGNSNCLFKHAIAILTLECHILDIVRFYLLNEQTIGDICSIGITRTILRKKHKEIIGNYRYNHKNDCAEKQTTTVGATFASGIIAIASIARMQRATCPTWIVWILIHICCLSIHW